MLTSAALVEPSLATASGTRLRARTSCRQQLVKPLSAVELQDKMPHAQELSDAPRRASISHSYRHKVPCAH